MNSSLYLCFQWVLAGGGGGVGVPALFKLRELPCYLSSTYEILPLLLNLLENKIS